MRWEWKKIEVVVAKIDWSQNAKRRAIRLLAFILALQPCSDGDFSLAACPITARLHFEYAGTRAVSLDGMLCSSIAKEGSQAIFRRAPASLMARAHTLFDPARQLLINSFCGESSVH